MTKCNFDKTQLILYLYDELAEQERTGFETHLKSCPECQTEVDDYRRIMNQLAKIPDVEPSNAAPFAGRGPFGFRLPYPKSRIMRFVTYSAIAASFLMLAVITYLKLPTLTTTTTVPDTHTVTNVSISQDKELYAWDSGISDEIDRLKDSATTIVNNLKTSPLASLDDSLDKIDTDIKTISTETD